MRTFAIALTALLVGCSKESAPAEQPAGDRPTSNELTRTAQQPERPPTRAPRPLAEPEGQIEPKTTEGARRVLQQYGALIEQGRWTEAATCWSDREAATAFEKQLRSLDLKHLQIGKPGDLEGAAGSIYANVFVSFSGPDTDWGPSGRNANAILRRANDVPGSTAAQRRWHIERIEWMPMP